MILDQINEYWSLIIGFITVIIFFVRMEAAIKVLKERDDSQEAAIQAMKEQHRKDMNSIKDELKENNVEFTKIEVAIKGIETTLEFIKDRISRIKL
jgi:hypothetical protein